MKIFRHRFCAGLYKYCAGAGGEIFFYGNNYISAQAALSGFL